MKIDKDILEAQEYVLHCASRTAEYEEYTKNFNRLLSQLEATIGKEELEAVHMLVYERMMAEMEIAKQMFREGAAYKEYIAGKI